MRQKINKSTGLTDNQERFCRYYVKNGNNGSEAYKSAGYSKSNSARTSASVLLDKPLVETYIKDYRRVYALEQESTVEGVLEKLRWIWGLVKEEKLYQHCLKCVELEGKYHNMFSDKIVISDEAPQEIDSKAIPDLLKKARLLNIGLAKTGTERKE